MKILVFLTALFAVFENAKPANPVFEGSYADPEGVVYGEKYWIFPTKSGAMSFDAFSSYNLVSWTKHENIATVDDADWIKFAMWAPSAVYNNGTYYLFFGANDIHEGELGGIGVFRSDNPGGPYKDLIGSPLIPDIITGPQPIDQFVFQDLDGTYYMYYGGWGHCNIVKLGPGFTSILPFEDGTLHKEITPEGYTEGPFMFHRQGKYYFMWSEGNWMGDDYRVAYAIADSIFGPFTRIGIILEQDPNVGTGAGHHSVIKVPNEDKYYIVYHRYPLGSDQRVSCVDNLNFNEDGTIVPVVMTFEGVVGVPLL